MRGLRRTIRVSSAAWLGLCLGRSQRHTPLSFVHATGEYMPIDAI